MWNGWKYWVLYLKYFVISNKGNGRVDWFRDWKIGLYDFRWNGRVLWKMVRVIEKIRVVKMGVVL